MVAVPAKNSTLDKRTPLLDGFFSVFKPRPRLTVSQWAEKHRVLPPNGAAESGPWRNSRTPYLTEIMDALSASSPTKEVVFCKGSQIGATEAGLNWLMYLIDQEPGPILALQPTEKNAKDWSRQRIEPSLELCPRTRSRIEPAKSRSTGNTILQKNFAGGLLFLAGTNSASSLASLPIGNLYFDEVDRYPRDVEGEGDPMDLALRRIATFPRAKAFFTSTPTLKSTSKIWDLYQKSDRRVYDVPCPYCGHYDEITFDRLHWDKGDPESVHLECGNCGSLIPEHFKTDMLANGRWRATNPGHWRAGFHLSSLYSPKGWLSWAKAVRTFEEAAGDVTKMVSFTNTILGLPWEEDMEGIALEYLTRRIEEYPAEVPNDVLRLTMAVDVQNDRLECEVVGWGEHEESWGIRYQVIMSDLAVLSHEKGGYNPKWYRAKDVKRPEDPTVWELLDDLRLTKFRRADGREMSIFCTVIDSGGSFTDVVYQYTKLHEAERVYAIKGGSQPRKPLLGKHTRAGAARAALFVLGVDVGKELVYSRLKLESPGPGYCHFPDNESSGYNARTFASLVNEDPENVDKDETEPEATADDGNGNDDDDDTGYFEYVPFILIKSSGYRLEKNHDIQATADIAITFVVFAPEDNREAGFIDLFNMADRIALILIGRDFWADNHWKRQDNITFSQGTGRKDDVLDSGLQSPGPFFGGAISTQFITTVPNRTIDEGNFRNFGREENHHGKI